jgi:hypothetical protein
MISAGEKAGSSIRSNIAIRSRCEGRPSEEPGSFLHTEQSVEGI